MKPPAASSSSTTRRPRRALRYAIVGLVFVGIAWWAPTIIVNSPLKSTIESVVSSSFAGQVSIGTISAGWLSPIAIEDIVAQDEQGETVFQVRSARTEKTLAALLFDRSQLGTIAIHQPQVNLILRADGSNLEDFVAPLQKESQTSPVDWRVDVSQGAVVVTDRESTKKSTVDKIELTVESRATDKPSIDARLRAAVAGNTKSGSLEANLAWQPLEPDNGQGFGQGVASITTDAIPLAMCQAPLRRLVPQVQIEGLLAGGIELEWSGDLVGALKFDSVLVEQFSLESPTWMDNERVAIDSIDLQGVLTREGNTWRVNDFALDSPVLELHADGSGAIGGGVAQGEAFALSDFWKQADYQVEAQMDVAKIAHMLRKTLHIREEVELTGGKISASIKAEPAPDSNEWNVHVTGEQLTGKHHGRDIQLDAPIEVQLTARRTGDAYNVDRFSCESSFLNLTGKGSPANGSVSIHGDLTQFVSEIDRFADIGSLSLAGSLRAELDWNKSEQETVVISGDATVEQFQMSIDDTPPWREERLTAKLTATRVVDSSLLRGPRQATIRLESNGDVLQAELSAPLEKLSLDADIPLNVRMEGDIESWLSRVQRFMPLSDWVIAGEMQATAQLLASSKRIRFDETNVDVRGLNARARELHIQESELKVQGSGHWDATSRDVRIDAMTLATSSVAFRAERVDISTLASDFRLAGAIGYRANLSKLAAWRSLPRDGQSWRLGGEAEGHLRVEHDNDAASAEWSTTVKDFLVETPNDTQARPPHAWTTQWKEPSLKLSGKGNYSFTKDIVTFDQFNVQGDALGVAASGSIANPQERCVIDIAGQLECDLPKVTEMLSAHLGHGIRLVGHETRPFSFRGPLRATEQHLPRVITAGSRGFEPSKSFMSELEAEAGLAWTSAHLQGFQFGPGEMQGSLSNGVLDLAPFEAPLSDGKVSLTSRVLLNRSPAVLQIAQGQVANQVRITPEMCQSWLKYVAPLVAGATTAEGRFSVSLNTANIPIGQATDANVEGELIVHEAHLGPGAVTRDLIGIAEQVRAITKRRPFNASNRGPDRWLDLPEQRVAFQMVEGRVYHRGLQMHVQDVAIKTHGSVGIDQSLSMVAEVPIHESWVANDRYLAGLKGQVIKIPIRGSLSQPRVDGRVLENIATQAAREAATQLLEKEIGRGLEKLFSPNR